MINRHIIYDAPQEKFFQDVRLNKFVDIMEENFKNFAGRQVGASEHSSWVVTGDKIKNLLELADVKDSHVSFEYQVPYTSMRIDCMLYGTNKNEKGNVIHIELKQWQRVEATEIEGNFVETYTGGGTRTVPHPSQQVEGYHDHLSKFVVVIAEGELSLVGYSYCPNYRSDIGEGLFNPIYQPLLEKFPIFTHDDVEKLAGILKEMLENGEGLSIFNKFMQSPYRPSKKVLESASRIVAHNTDFTLLNEQIAAKNVIMNKIKKADSNREKSTVIVRGGPGTGKTVIALHLLAEIAQRKRTVFFASKSKPLIEALRFKVNNRDARYLFTNLESFTPSRVDENDYDVLIVDESHRIQEKSGHQFTNARDRTDMPQVEQLIRCAKTSVFFIDDNQNIRNGEIGSSPLIRSAAMKLGRSVAEVDLVSQFRCGGSDNYLDWLESALGYSQEKRIFNAEIERDRFDFRVFDSPQELYDMIVKRNSEEGTTARITAGFCWDWSKTLDANGEMVKDVRIGDFAMPWETHYNISPPKGYVQWYEWAYKPEGIKQVGCIYTAQGFEFDYIGVIVGADLKYDPQKDCLVGDIKATRDPKLRRGKDKFNDYVRNIYRVLMSRGMKGCYVYFVDKETENFFKSRIGR